MKYEMKGFDRVFAFTFSQQWKGKKFLCATIITAVLCFLLPALIMLSVAALGNEEEHALPENSEAVVSALTQVYVADRSSSPEVDLHFLNTLAGQGNFSTLTYRSFGADVHAAAEAAQSGDGTVLILCLDEGADGSYTARVLLPDASVLSEQDVEAYRGFILQMFPYVLSAKLGVTPTQMSALTAPVEIAAHSGAVLPEEDTGGDEEQSPSFEAALPQEQARQMLSMILPYFNIMILYFMVLFYGQSVANSVILEKTSKLVDTFLVTVRPGAMVLGKMLAIAMAGALQLILWLGALLGGFVTGGILVRALVPDAQMGLLAWMDSVKLWSGAFSLPGFVLSLLILLGGFLLYCALAAIGGAMASKPEELSSTNGLFSMVLVISFFCTLYAGGMGAGMSSSAAWLNWVPFTAILVAPSRILMGELSLAGAAVSLGLILITAFLLILLAGKIYRMLILYKGKVPKLGDVLKMLVNRN